MIRTAFFALALTITSSTAFAADFDLDAGAKVFKKCAACHTVGEGAKNKVGPVLNGVVGRDWGIIEGFKYSKGKPGSLLEMAKEGRVWDVATLDEFVTKPKKLIKKTKMAFAGLKKEDDRKNLIAYLAQYNADGTTTDPVAVLEAN